MTSSSILFRFNCSWFSDANGAVRYFAVIVAESDGTNTEYLNFLFKNKSQTQVSAGDCLFFFQEELITCGKIKFIICTVRSFTPLRLLQQPLRCCSQSSATHCPHTGTTSATRLSERIRLPTFPAAARRTPMQPQPQRR